MAKRKSKPKDRFDESELPEEGAVFAFQLSDGRWGACRVLRKLPIAKTELGEWSSKKVEGWCVRVAVTPWVGKKLPKLAELLLQQVLTLTHHNWKGTKEVGLIACPPDGAFVYIGNLPPSAKDRRQKEATLCLGEWPLEFWARQVQMQWEWDHTDREKLLAAEQAKKQTADEKEDRAKDRRTARLRKLSLADFRRTRFVPGWSRIATPEAVRESRQAIDEAIGRMIALGRRPQRKPLLAEVKRLIQEFNKLQKKHDGFIATTERDDLCVLLGDLFVVACLEDDPALVFERWEDL